MTKPILLLDQDGPLADMDTAIFQMCDRMGIVLDVDNPSEQRHRFVDDHVIGMGTKGYPHTYRTTKTVAKGARRNLRHAIWDDASLFGRLPVVEGAYEGVAQLEEHFDVWVCTKPLERNPGCRDGKQAWIDEHFPSLSNKLIQAPDKAMVHGAILLDDAIKPEWLPRATWRPVAFTTPWNGDGSEWEALPHWGWGDPVEVLFALGGRLRQELPA